jgi:hypothetical protein
MSVLQVEQLIGLTIKITNVFYISGGVQWKILRDHIEEIDGAVEEYGS